MHSFQLTHTHTLSHTHAAAKCSIRATFSIQLYSIWLIVGLDTGLGRITKPKKDIKNGFVCLKKKVLEEVFKSFGTHAHTHTHWYTPVTKNK